VFLGTSVASPSTTADLAHLSDTDTGLAWATGTGDILSIIAGGVEMMRFTEAATDIVYIGGDNNSGIAHLNDANTGIRWDYTTGDEIHLVASAVEVLTVNASSVQINGKPVFSAGSVLTIATGAITVTHGYHEVGTEGAAATDDLDTVNGGTYTGQQLILAPTSSTQDITFKDNTGNMRLNAGDFAPTNNRGRLGLTYDASAAKWFEMWRATN